MRKKMQRKGFSLMELVVCMVIIGILALMIIPQIGEITHRAKVSTFTTNAKNIETSIITYQGDNNGEYPQTGKDLDPYLQGGFESLNNRPNGAEYIYEYDSKAGKPTLTCSINLDGKTYTYSMKDGFQEK